MCYLTELQNSTTDDLMLHGKCGANAWPHAPQLTRILHDNLTKKKNEHTVGMKISIENDQTQ